MLVSIIIPTYNREKLLPTALESALNQTYNDIEILVIDDGSTDETKKLVEDYSRKFKNIRYFYQYNSGASTARNFGIEMSKGEYISFLDSDDSIYAQKIEKQMECIIKDNKDVCYCNYDINRNNSISINKMKFSNTDILIKYLKNQIVPNTNSWLIKKSILTDNKILFRSDCSWGEDMEFFIKVLVYAKVTYTPLVLSRCNIDGADRLSSFDWDKIEKDIFIWNEIKVWLLSEIKVKHYRKQIEEIIEAYRIPALILYRIYAGRENKKIAQEYLKKYTDLISKMNYCNGLRSVKLFLIWIKVKLMMKV